MDFSLLEKYFKMFLRCLVFILFEFNVEVFDLKLNFKTE